MKGALLAALGLILLNRSESDNERTIGGAVFAVALNSIFLGKGGDA